MRKMKNSGIEWIGEIPHKWELKRLKALFLERKEKNNPVQTDFILSLGAAYGVVPYSEKEGGGNKAKEDLTDYRLAYPNDIVMNSMNIISGSVGISKYFGCVSPVYYILYPRYDNISSDFFCYIFQTKAFQRSLLGLGNGILIKESSNGNFNTVRMRIPMEKLGVQLLPLPPLNEQQKIASFLDQKCAEIDAVIEKTKATIEEYKKLKQSVITEAVTKGIRGNRPMKDSGIEWIGEIPVEWDVNSIKSVATTCSGGTPYSGDESLYDGDINWICSYDLKEKTITESGRKITQKGADAIAGKMQSIGSILIAMYGGSGTIGNSGILKCEARTNQAVCSVKFNNNFILDYYGFYYILSIRKHWMVYAVGTRKDPNISQDIIKRMTCIIPPIAEQKEIADYLDQKCAEIDTLIAKKTTLLSELENYKKSLIYEYVTGKKEVGEDNVSTQVAVYSPYFPITINSQKLFWVKMVLMAEILEKFNYRSTRVKLQKTIFVIQNSIGFDLDNEYVREKHGPLDNSIFKCENSIKKRGWIKVIDKNGATNYKAGENKEAYQKDYDRYFAKYDTEIDRIINIFKDYDAKKSERIATLFGAWNDAIIDKRQFTDEDIVEDVLNNWHEHKGDYSRKEWLEDLEEMKRINLIPKGYGKKTVFKKD